MSEQSGSSSSHGELRLGDQAKRRRPPPPPHLSAGGGAPPARTQGRGVVVVVTETLVLPVWTSGERVWR